MCCLVDYLGMGWPG